MLLIRQVKVTAENNKDARSIEIIIEGLTGSKLALDTTSALYTALDNIANDAFELGLKECKNAGS